MLLVTAGYDDNLTHIKSTEVQLTRSSSWQVVEDYPLALGGLRGATINNIVYMTGGEHFAKFYQLNMMVFLKLFFRIFKEE